MRMIRTAGAVSVLTVCSGVIAGDNPWVRFDDETATRLPTDLNDPNITTDDPDQKAYAVGDVDKDGDDDLIVARKQAWTTTGQRRNVLLMNEGIVDGHATDGILVDRTAEFASASDVPGDQGFLTPTNDWDVILVDVDGDTWLDIVTAVGLTDNQAKHLSHPRVYMNLGESAGVWQGFEYQDGRFPLMHKTAGPRFASVSAGDIDGVNGPDLFFTDFDAGGTQIFDFDNRVLLNDGSGNFSDQTASVLPDSDMTASAYGIAGAIADMNNDGANDLVKQTSLNAPQYVGVIYNDPNNVGVMSTLDVVYSSAAYHMTVGDLNNDGLIDIVVVDDNADRYLLNQGDSDADDMAEFTTHEFLLEAGGSESSFGGNPYVVDLDNDGWNDVVIADVDTDIPNCFSDRAHIYRNLGGQPGDNVILREQDEVIPVEMLEGVHDVAILDLDGDDRLDIILGRCDSTEIWRQAPSANLLFTYPDGRPESLEPGVETVLALQVTGAGLVDGSVRLFVSIDDGPFEQGTTSYLGGSLYEVTLPAVECLSSVRYYLEADTAKAGTDRDPSTAPGVPYFVVAAAGFAITVDEFEGGPGGWTTEADPSLTAGFWQLVDPIGTTNGSDDAAPEVDSSPSGTMCWVTENGEPGGPVGAADVDGGPTSLISPVINLLGSDAVIVVDWWFYTNGDDDLTVEVSNDAGQTWVRVASTDGTMVGPQTGWNEVSFQVGAHVEPTDSVQVRFTTADQPNNNITEAAIDGFEVHQAVCTPCPGDLDSSGHVGVGDLLTLLGAWGTCEGCPADLDGSGGVQTPDLLILLSLWGDCPE